MVIRKFISIGILIGASSHAVDHTTDVVIYGGTSAAMTAAVQVKKMRKKPILVSPDQSRVLEENGYAFIAPTLDQSLQRLR